MLDECVPTGSRLVWSLPAFLLCVLQEGSYQVIPPGSSLIGQRRMCRPGYARKGCRISSPPSPPTTSTEQSSAGSTRTRQQSWELVRPGTHNAVTFAHTGISFSICGDFMFDPAAQTAGSSGRA